MTFPRQRLAAALPALALVFGIAACSSAGASTDCSLNSCTVTFDRGVNANASILGVKAELVGVQGDQVTLKIAGQSVTVPASGGQASSDGFNVSVQSVTKKNVIVKVSRAG
jgi:hypothetical protein